MGASDVALFHSWVDGLTAAEEPLDYFHEHMWAPDIDYRAIEGAPDDVGPIVGRDAMRAYLADWYEMFPDLVLVPEEVTDAGPGRVVVIWHASGTAKASGIPTELRLAIVYAIRDGRIVRGREFLTKDEAFAAAADEV